MEHSKQGPCREPVSVDELWGKGTPCSSSERDSYEGRRHASPDGDYAVCYSRVLTRYLLGAADPEPDDRSDAERERNKAAGKGN
jgi:hypothetical protein